MKRRRKQTEAAPPSKWLRSKGGRSFKIIKTNKVNDADEWLYRNDYGTVIGNSLSSISDLESHGCTFLEGQPEDWELGQWRRQDATA